jgi:oligopeptidase B
VFDYDMNTGKSTLLKQTKCPADSTPANYKSERVFATATDGTKIPMSMVYRKGVKMDGSAPLLLYGYGSYGASIPPTFSSNSPEPARPRRDLRDRHIRGGGELGEEWREAGRMMNKMNTFTDFIACANAGQQQVHLEGSSVIQGGSAGGLLMGAVATCDRIFSKRSFRRCRSSTC